MVVVILHHFAASGLSRVRHQIRRPLMVKTPKTRHSKTQREPVTIELEPDEVSRIDGSRRRGRAERRRIAQARAAMRRRTPTAVTDAAVGDVTSRRQPQASRRDTSRIRAGRAPRLKPMPRRSRSDYDFDADETAQPSAHRRITRARKPSADRTSRTQDAPACRCWRPASSAASWRSPAPARCNSRACSARPVRVAARRHWRRSKRRSPR